MFRKICFFINTFVFLLSFQVSQSFSIEPPRNTGPFHNRSDAVFSPMGTIPADAKVFSPDGSKYVSELKPINTMKIGVFEKKTNKLLKGIDLAYSMWKNNDIKGLAWSPNSKMLAVMFHHHLGGDVIILNAESGEKIKPIRIDTYYHYMAFSSDGHKIIVSFSGRDNDLHYLDINR